MTCALRQHRMKSRVALPSSTVLSRLAARREVAVEARPVAIESSRCRTELRRGLRQATRRLSFPLAYERRLKCQRQEQPKTKSKADPLAASAHRRYKPATPPVHATSRCLTQRSTGAPTAGHLAHEALTVYPAPRGQGVHPSSPG